MDSIVHGVAKSQTQLSDFHFHMQIKINKKAHLPTMEALVIF